MTVYLGKCGVVIMKSLNFLFKKNLRHRYNRKSVNQNTNYSTIKLISKNIIPENSPPLGGSWLHGQLGMPPPHPLLPRLV